jgi:glycosyltransferase involved in cell wall biosynthesis
MVSPVVEGGIATHLREIMPRLRQRGHNIVLITARSYAAVTPADSVKTYHSWAFPTALYGFMPVAIYDVLKVVKECDVIHIHGYPHFLADYLTVTRPCHRKPLVLTFHGSFHQFTSRKLAYFKKLHNLLLLRFAGLVDRFIAVSQAEKAEVVKLGVAKKSVEVVYNGISERYAKLQRGKRRGTGEKKILYLGRLTSSKNPELLIKAMLYVAESVKEAKLIMAGPDWGERRSLENLVSQLGMETAVQFTGEVNEEQKMNLLASCDILVHPSLQDIFSLSVLEATAAGLPAVAFKVGGNAEMVLDGQTGILVGETTAEALSAAIVNILSNDELAEKMGREAREYTSSKFSWEETVSRLEKIYYDLAGLEHVAI